MMRNIEIDRFRLFRPKVRTPQKSKSGDIVESRFRLLPFNAGIFNPKAGVVMFATIGHPFRVQELNSEVETAHLCIFLYMSDEFVLEAVRVALLQRPRQIVGGRSSLKLNDVDRPVTKGHITPVAQLLIRFYRL